MLICLYVSYDHFHTITAELSSWEYWVACWVWPTKYKILSICLFTEKVGQPILMGCNLLFEKLWSKLFYLKAPISIHVRRAVFLFLKNLRATLFSVPHKINPDEQTLVKKHLFLAALWVWVCVIQGLVLRKSWEEVIYQYPQPLEALDTHREEKDYKESGEQNIMFLTLSWLDSWLLLQSLEPPEWRIVACKS